MKPATLQLILWVLSFHSSRVFTLHVSQALNAPPVLQEVIPCFLVWASFEPCCVSGGSGWPVGIGHESYVASISVCGKQESGFVALGFLYVHLQLCLLKKERKEKQKQAQAYFLFIVFVAL